MFGSIGDIKIKGLVSNGLVIDRFAAGKGEAWCIAGRMGSGLDLFFRLVSGQIPPENAKVMQIPDEMGIVSFERLQCIYEDELKKDETDFIDRLDPGTPAHRFITDIEKVSELISAFRMEDCLDKGFRQLSTGQSRKLLLLSQMSKGVSCLLIQSPFDGLDTAGTEELVAALNILYQKEVLLLLFVRNTADIPGVCTHMAVMDKGSIRVQGRMDKVKERLDRGFLRNSGQFVLGPEELAAKETGIKKSRQDEELVRLNRGAAGYGSKTVFKGLNLLIREGEHTLVTGPNGCGKSTLLHVITGDHPACYTNDLHLFGIRRGSGESVWDLKKNMGIVSSDLHRNYLVPGSVLNCMLSGFFDSIGLYRSVSEQQKNQALLWLKRLGLSGSAYISFRELSFARQRLVLIGRALIKLPRLLVLDEPTQGLDEGSRKALLMFLSQVADQRISTILYVSHRQDEFKDFFVQRINMV